MYIYIDESGDIGINSKYLIFAAISLENPRTLEKLMKKVWKAKPQYHKKSKLHATDVDDATRKRVLKEISEIKCDLQIFGFKKPKDIIKQNELYYKNLADFIKKQSHSTVIVVERKDTVAKRQHTIQKLNLTDIFKNVAFEDPHKYKQLQAVDFIAWAYGRKMEFNDDNYINILRINDVNICE